MKSLIFKSVLLTMLLAGPALLLAHEEPHDDSTQTTDTVRETQDATGGEHDHNEGDNHATDTHENGNASTIQANAKPFAPFSDFPNLHPLVVHFPIVLLLLAFFSQIAALFVYRKPLSWVTLLLLAGGFLGALLASQVFHAHAEGLSESAHEIFETHESLASVTLWLSGIALVFKIISHFVFDAKKWAEWIVLLVITGAAVTVSLTGHLGSQMVYLEEIGPGGNKVEQHHDE